jgi:hypothetical protein
MQEAVVGFLVVRHFVVSSAFSLSPLKRYQIDIFIYVLSPRKSRPGTIFHRKRLQKEEKSIQIQQIE